MAPSDDVRALLSRAERLAAVTDEMSASYATELRRVLRDLERQLATLAADALAGDRTATVQAARAAALRDQLREALTTAGYDDLADAATTAALDRMVRALRGTRLGAAVGRFVAGDATRLSALVELARLDLMAVGDEIATALWRSLTQAIFSARPLRDVLDDLADALDQSVPEVRTLFDTYTAQFGRLVDSANADGTPAEVFAYMGPVDARMRPFCRARIGKVYTRTEIDAMDNGQLPNPFLTAGGYNCRHAWMRVSPASTLNDLVGTDERVPEVAAALARVKPKVRAKAA